MFISIQDLAIRRVEFHEDWAPRTLDLGSDLFHDQPLRASGHADLVEEHGGRREVVNDIRLVGDYATRVELHCARCLEPITRELAGSFDVLYRPLGIDAGRSEAAIQEAETEIGYYSGGGVLLEDVLKEQILLAVPVKVVCWEGCKGLCPHCGRNLNQEACACAEPAQDARWAALRELRDKFRES